MTRPRLVPLGVGALALLLYLWTAAPTITWRNGGIDSGELAAAVATGGVAHPPGYPTYLLLGRLVTLLPVEPARALAWLSAACAAVAVACAAAGGRIGAAEARGAAATSERSHDLVMLLAALAPASVLATSRLVWSSATYAEVNAPAAALAGAWLVLRPWRPAPAIRLFLVGAMLGVGLGLHVLLLFLAIPIALGHVREGRPASRSGRIGALVLGIVLGACVFALLRLWPPAGPVNWYAPQSGEGWWRLVSAEAYRGLVDLGGASPRALLMLRLVVENLALLGAVAAVAGVQEVLSRRQARGSGGTLACAGTALLYVLFAALYVARDTEVYLLPALVLLSPAIGAGVVSAGALFGQRSPVSSSHAGPAGLGAALLAGLCLLPGAVQGARNLPAMNLRDDRTALTYAERVLAEAPPNAAVIASGDAATFALWYARYALGVRQDVAVLNEDLLYEDWYRGQLRRLHPSLTVPAWSPGLEAPSQLVEQANRGRTVWAPEPDLP